MCKSRRRVSSQGPLRSAWPPHFYLTWSNEASSWSTGRVVRRFFARFSPPRWLGASFESKAPGQRKARWIIPRNGSAQLAQLTTNSELCFLEPAVPPYAPLRVFPAFDLANAQLAQVGSPLSVLENVDALCKNHLGARLARLPQTVERNGN